MWHLSTFFRDLSPISRCPPPGLHAKVRLRAASPISEHAEIDQAAAKFGRLSDFGLPTGLAR
jgi:hypothetical protein